MSLLDIARDTLKDLPVSDILRERLSLALDLAAQSETKHAETQAQLARAQAQLEIVCLDRDKTQQELQRLKEAHAEEVRVERTIEFRRGARTGASGRRFVHGVICLPPSWTTMRHFAPTEIATGQPTFGAMRPSASLDSFEL